MVSPQEILPLIWPDAGTARAWYSSLTRYILPSCSLDTLRPVVGILVHSSFRLVNCERYNEKKFLGKIFDFLQTVIYIIPDIEYYRRSKVAAGKIILQNSKKEISRSFRERGIDAYKLLRKINTLTLHRLFWKLGIAKSLFTWMWNGPYWCNFTPFLKAKCIRVFR